MQISNLINKFPEAATLKMTQLARDLSAQGVNVISLSVGEPDFATPKHIVEAAEKAMEDGFTKYSPVPGYPDLREAVVTKLKRDNNLTYTADQIVVSTGAKQSLANVVLSVVNPGDEVLIPTPYWVTYSAQVEIAGGICRFLKCGIEEGFKLTPSKLEASITAKTRMFIFSSPCNPSGVVYTKAELQALAIVFAKHPEIVVVSDEIYEYINYTGKHESIAQFPEIKDQVVVVNGMSKGYSMTGWRLGYIAAPIELAKACTKLQGQFTSGANSIAQKAGVAALLGDMHPTQSMVKAFKERKDYVIEALREIPGVKIAEPHGAFYAFPDVSHFFDKMDEDRNIIRNSNDLAMFLLDKAHVSCVSGDSFGAPDCIRFSFATSMDKLKKAFADIKEALATLR